VKKVDTAPETVDNVKGTETTEKHNEKRRIEDTIDDNDDDEEEELDEFGRVKRRRQKFRSERNDDDHNTEEGVHEDQRKKEEVKREDGEESDIDDNEDDRRYRRSYRRRRSSGSRYSDEDEDDEDYHRYRRSNYSRRDSSPHYRRSYRRHHQDRRSSQYRSGSESPDEEFGRRRRRSSRHRNYPDNNRNPYDAAARYIDTEFYATKIYIGDLEGVSYDDLERTFGRYGPVRQVKMVENKDYAFVTYDDQESAMAAIQNMHGALFGSRHIKVNRAKIPERNQVGFGNVPWTDEDGNLAKEEMQSYPVSREISPLFGSDNHTPPPMGGRTLTSYDDL
ncbi:hypothetical protein INT45_001914, partial [Circinella minor]